MRFYLYFQRNLNYHYRMHTMSKDYQYSYKCPMSNCRSSFKFPIDLEIHIRIHNNDLGSCQYCSFRYNKIFNYFTHLKEHGSMEFKFSSSNITYNWRDGTMYRVILIYVISNAINVVKIFHRLANLINIMKCTKE